MTLRAPLILNVHQTKLGFYRIHAYHPDINAYKYNLYLGKY